MMRLMMKYLMINCKEATYLTGLKEEGILSFGKRLKLAMHTAMCSLCKRFEKQAAAIKKESIHLSDDALLSNLAIEKLQKKVTENLS